MSPAPTHDETIEIRFAGEQSVWVGVECARERLLYLVCGYLDEAGWSLNFSRDQQELGAHLQRTADVGVLSRMRDGIDLRFDRNAATARRRFIYRQHSEDGNRDLRSLKVKGFGFFSASALPYLATSVIALQAWCGAELANERVKLLELAIVCRLFGELYEASEIRSLRETEPDTPSNVIQQRIHDTAKAEVASLP